MSALTLFANGSNALPDHLRELAETDELTKRLAGGDQNKSISIEGGVWRMMIGSDEVAKNEDRAMELVIVNVAPHVSRIYYPGQYVKGQAAEPSCYSADGRTPADDSPAKQSLTCQSCPQNIAGSGQGDSRACRFNQRVAVVLGGDLGGNVYRLQLPAKSLFGKGDGHKMPLQAYAKHLAGHGVPISGVVTEARFDTSQSVPVLTFRAVRPLTREEVAVVREQGMSDDSVRAIEFKMAPRKKPAVAAPAPAQAQLAQLFSDAEPDPAPSPAPVAQRVAAEPVDPAPAPVVRQARKPAAPAPVAVSDISSVLSEWGHDD